MEQDVFLDNRKTELRIDRITVRRKDGDRTVDITYERRALVGAPDFSRISWTCYGEDLMTNDTVSTRLMMELEEMHRIHVRSKETGFNRSQTEN